MRRKCEQEVRGGGGRSRGGCGSPERIYCTSIAAIAASTCMSSAAAHSRWKREPDWSKEENLPRARRSGGAASSAAGSSSWST